MNWADAYERISGALKEERAAHKLTAQRLTDAAALLNDWMVTIHHVPAEQLAHAVADLNARIAPFLASLPTTPATAGSTPRE